MASISASSEQLSRVQHPSFVASVAGAIMAFCDLFAASARVAQAVEARRAPRPADLRILGINEPLPRSW